MNPPPPHSHQRQKAHTKGSSTPPAKASPNAADTPNHKKQSASVDDLLGLDFNSPSDASGSGGQWPAQGTGASTNPFGSGGKPSPPTYTQTVALTCSRDACFL